MRNIKIKDLIDSWNNLNVYSTVYICRTGETSFELLYSGELKDMPKNLISLSVKHFGTNRENVASIMVE